MEMKFKTFSYLELMAPNIGLASGWQTCYLGPLEMGHRARLEPDAHSNLENACAQLPTKPSADLNCNDKV